MVKNHFPAIGAFVKHIRGIAISVLVTFGPLCADLFNERVRCTHHGLKFNTFGYLDM